MAGQRCSVTPQIKRKMNGRAAVELALGHIKAE
jgi:hypothetical protein